MKKLLFLLLTFAIVLSLASCDWFEQDDNQTTEPNTEHVHTWEYVQYETGHFKQFTCGCPSPDIMGEHYDNDGDYVCDACTYAIKIGGAFEFEYVASEEGHCEHKVGTACDGTCVKSPHEDNDNDFQCDYCKYLLDTSGIAQIVLDYEQGLRDNIDKLHAEHPEYNYYYHPVDEVYCTFVLSDNTSANDIVAKYDMKNLFANADIHAYNAIEMITVIFDRDDFTEEMHRKIKQINQDEAFVENLYVEMERAYYQSYMPKIEYYTDCETALKYEPSPYAVSTENSRDIIIKTKAEYDAYLDELLESWVAEDYLMAQYQIEIINNARDKYDEAFFEENALILTRMITRGSGSIKLTVNNLYVSENKVYVVIRTDIPMAGTGDMRYAFFAFVVDKDDVVNVNEVITLD